MEVINRNEVEPFVTKDSSELREIMLKSGRSCIRAGLVT